MCYQLWCWSLTHYSIHYFEQIKNIIIAKDGPKAFTAVKAFFIGAFGKLIATSLTYPYITLKSRMHIKRKKLNIDNQQQDEENNYP